MFFVIGMSPKRWQLSFRQQGICPVCGRMARFEGWASANCLSLFFIPVLRFGKRYYLVSACCGASCELPRELGRSMERGEVDRLDLSQFQFSGGRPQGACPGCGAEVDPAFSFCPHCGARL